MDANLELTSPPVGVIRSGVRTPSSAAESRNSWFRSLISQARGKADPWHRADALRSAVAFGGEHGHLDVGDCIGVGAAMISSRPTRSTISSACPAVSPSASGAVTVPP
jgi:hypothetical protein